MILSVLTTTLRKTCARCFKSSVRKYATSGQSMKWIYTLSKKNLGKTWKINSKISNRKFTKNFLLTLLGSRPMKPGWMKQKHGSMRPSRLTWTWRRCSSNPWKDRKQCLKDMEGWSRRNNIHIYSVPEGIEGSSVPDFVEQLLKSELALTADKSMQIQRTHRALARKP